MSDSPYRDRPLLCPSCHRDLELAEDDTFGFAQVFECSGCDGVWCDPGELDTLDESVQTNAEELPFQRAAADDEPLRCPRCTGALEPLRLPAEEDVALARCGECAGFWITKPMIGALRQYVLDLDSGNLRFVDLTDPKSKKARRNGARLAIYR